MNNQKSGLILFSFLFLCSVGIARGEVVDSSTTGFTVRSVLTIKATPAEVYHDFTAHVGLWWSSAHTFSGHAQNLSLEDKANGCFCENLDSGGTVRHLVVVLAEPGKMLRMSGALGPLQSLAVAGSMTWSLSTAGAATRVEFTYTVSGYRPGGLSFLAPKVDAVLSEQLQRLKRYVERGDPDGPNAR